MGNKHRDLKNTTSQLSLCPKTHSLPYFKSALRLSWIITEDRTMCNPWHHRFQASGSGMTFPAGLSLLSVLSLSGLPPPLGLRLLPPKGDGVARFLRLNMKSGAQTSYVWLATPARKAVAELDCRCKKMRIKFSTINFVCKDV